MNTIEILRMVSFWLGPIVASYGVYFIFWHGLKQREEALRAEVRVLLGLMDQLDPNCGETRHPVRPLQLRGDEDATGQMVRCLNRLQDLTR